AHGGGGQRAELRLPAPLEALAVDEANPSLVHQRRRLESVPVLLVTEIAVGESTQLAVDVCEQALARSGIAARELQEIVRGGSSLVGVHAVVAPGGQHFESYPSPAAIVLFTVFVEASSARLRSLRVRRTVRRRDDLILAFQNS